MKIAKLPLLIVFVCMLLTVDTWAQKKKPAQKKTVKKTTTTVPKKKDKEVTKPKTEPIKPAPILDASQGEKKVRDIVAVLEYMLNMLGSNSTPSRDKDVLVTESYSKIFRDTKVQVEDDLDEQRNVITNKDIVPYLKDVDFFFDDAHFEFTIDKIEEGTTGSSTFYKVHTKRNLKGTTSDGQVVNKTIPRYIEINYDPAAQDLKIVSIYTNEFDEKRALANWWTELSYEWKSYFKKKLNLQDSVSLADIKKIISLESIDINNNNYIQDIEPLAQLSNLRYLNLAGTKIKDLSPLRNQTMLTELILSYTRVQDITPLKYASNLKRLSLDYSAVYSIDVIAKMPLLQQVTLAHTEVDDFSSLALLNQLADVNLKKTKLLDVSVIQHLSEISTLNLSGTAIRDLTPLAKLHKLAILEIDSTSIKSLAPLSNAESLVTLHANNTAISDLSPLLKLPRLEKIYCDKAGVTKETADAFMNARHGTLVIYNSEDLKIWWQELSPEWQTILKESSKITSDAPTKEELAAITNIDKLNLQGNSSIKSLNAISKLHKLRELNAGQTGITDLTPLRDNTDLTYLNIDETEVHDLSPISGLLKLTALHADKSKIESIAPLSNLKNLKKLYADQTILHDITALEFLEQNPTCLLIYKTIHLNRWWANLSEPWKEVFKKHMGTDTTTSRENLHQLTAVRRFEFSNPAVTDLSALSEFVQLKELHFSGTAIREIPPLENIYSLKSLHATSSPLQKIDALSKYILLEDLDISNTPLDDLKIIGSLKSLRNLNCAGTQVKRLNALEGLKSLENLDCSNTNVSNLDPVLYTPLKTLKCYNTKISKREIEAFKNINKGCEVVYYR